MVDLSVPSLSALSYALRHREVWPEHFRHSGWNFHKRGRCALGLAAALWPHAYAFPLKGYRFYFDRTTLVFNISREDAVRLFDNEGRMDATVLPNDVADTIDAYLVERKLVFA